MENCVHVQNEYSNSIGQLVILPSSFTDNPRYVYEKSQNVVSYVRYHSKSDLIITATFNPNWTEIKENINTDLSPQDRYYFHLKI